MVFDRVSAVERSLLEQTRRDPDDYGILRPRRDTNRTVKSVSRDTALLLYTLDEPSLLPRYVIEELGARCDSVIGGMIADGILQAEVGGRMLSGPAALEALEVTASTEGRGRLHSLSQRALEYGAALQIEDPRQLSWRLYTYNCVPASERWHRLLHDSAAVKGYLRGDDGKLTPMLGSRWVPSNVETTGAGWTAWHSVEPAKSAENVRIFKLYVSPACPELPARFCSIAQTLFDSPAFSWKAGNDVYGLLRSDKIVAYFHDLSDLHVTARRLQATLGQCTAHGVPFTARIDDAGLLSWGLDPARDPNGAALDERQSWRGRLCNLMATALIQAREAADGSAAPAGFAFQRLRLEGIDPDSFTPTADFDWYSTRGRI